MLSRPGAGTHARDTKPWNFTARTLPNLRTVKHEVKHEVEHLSSTGIRVL
jgi:hypothetical protein